MGGCYDDSYTYRRETVQPKPQIGRKVKSFFDSADIADLVAAYTQYVSDNGTSSGFNKKLLEHHKIAIGDVPKEFPEIEYEIKFELLLHTAGKKTTEPTLEHLLDALEFPPASQARFLKDAMNVISEGQNHFYGKDDEEMLVVIEKGGGKYLKEKSQPLPLETGVPGEHIVVKRTEHRYPATMDQVLQKIGAVTQQGGVYQGFIRKEKGDAFILDTADGRIYSFTITRAHLNNGERVQRQLELEYAGHIPGFPAFKNNDERQIITGMIALAQYTYALNNNTKVGSGHRLEMRLTGERKYDFVSKKQLPATVLALPAQPPGLVLPVRTSIRGGRNE